MCTQAYSQLKIGVINSEEILVKSKKGMEFQKRLETLQRNKSKEAEGMRENLKKLEQEVMSPTLTAETRQRKSQELEVKRNNLKRFIEEMQMEIRLENQKGLAALDREMMPLVKSYAQEKGFTVVHNLARSAIIYFDRSIDISADIIKLLDAS